MNIIDIVKSIIYSKQLAELELKLLEMQSGYNTLDKKRMDLHLELKDKNEYIKDLENKVINLTTINLKLKLKLKEKNWNINELKNKITANNKFIIQMQDTFQSKIDELKKVSDSFFTY
jgi:hypothetical protein